MTKRYSSLLLLLILVLFQSCKKEEESKTEPVEEITVADSATVAVDSTYIKYSVTIEAIDSIQFLSAEKNKKKQKAIKKITDFETAKRLLKGVVEFNQDEIKKINFRNGKTKHYEYIYFIGYFPEEDILLCEGGHVSDVSFDLSNGLETADVGNPGLVTSSPTNKFRLNEIDSGQECYEHFLQQNKNGKFTKIIQLGDVFEDKTNKWLCTSERNFWTDDHTLYFLIKEELEDKVTFEYYKIKIITNK